ncbi:hypothetical protein M8C10_02125 [Bacillus spizizenii]
MKLLLLFVAVLVPARRISYFVSSLEDSNTSIAVATSAYKKDLIKHNEGANMSITANNDNMLFNMNLHPLLQIIRQSHKH